VRPSNESSLTDATRLTSNVANTSTATHISTIRPHKKIEVELKVEGLREF
jgi:hypothetical protein